MQHCNCSDNCTVFLDKKGKKTPKYIIAIYLITAITGGIFTYKSLIDILPILSFVMYVMSILQNKERNVRKYTLIKLILWIPYDIYKMAFVSCIGRIITVISTIIGMIRLDKGKKESK